MKKSTLLSTAFTACVIFASNFAIPVNADSLSTYRASVKLTYSKLHDRSMDRRHRAEMAALEVREKDSDQSNPKSDPPKSQPGKAASGTKGNAAP